MRPFAALAMLALLGLGCPARSGSRDAGPRYGGAAPADGGAASMRVDPQPAPAPDAGPAPAPSPAPARLTVLQAQGGATVDTSLRIDGADAGAGVAAAAVGRSVLPGDAVLCGADGGVTLGVEPGGRITLRGNGVAEAAGHEGAALVLSLGVATVEVPPLTADAVRVDTPAGRVIVGAGGCTVAVADDGSTVVAATGPGVTVWPSPPAPPARATRLSAAQIAALRRQTPDHPVLLDVEIRELDAVLRPIASRALRAGEVLVFGPLGSVSATPRALARPAGQLASAAPLRAWVEARRPNVAAIGVLSRAGAADVADINAAITRLRGSGEALDDEGRARITSALSLALGRLAARARRGRDLAVRGGNVTALVQMARFEALRSEARSLR
jgi:hypothetical protein